MALNCIVDDSALLAGLSSDARYNITEWIADGAINAFVPLYTLERLNSLREAKADCSEQAQIALEWLDKLTSQTYKKSAGKVQLQGPDDQYSTWREVEKYILPDTPLSSRNGIGALTRSLERDLGIDPADKPNSGQSDLRDEDASQQAPSPRAPISADAGVTKSRRRHGKSGSPNGVPQRVRPLINFVVWRTYHEDSAADGPGHYILLTDDLATQKQAQKFGIRAKRMSQVSSIVTRNASKRLSAGATMIQTSEPEDEEEDEDIGLPPDERPPQEGAGDEVLFDPSKRPQSSRSVNVLDPNAFGRQPLNSPMLVSQSPAQTPRGPSNSTRGRGSRNQRRQTSPRANAAVARTSTDQVAPRSPNQKTRAAPGGRQQTRLPDPNKPIDPDSYARSAPGNRGRGRGGNRGRLWEPT
ncbi:hypothetical protein FH972_021499 [Carpinus fangiana]|uniref:PIN domain-containing protein n=1 Tax=Carpinus fangiana TaxID=176857 RepID=A0A5N6KRP4_9ROSI|nr:hypothetical protein FH972_021499 [Carpinus fangiana]